jgi:thiamine kinase-like enzyme
VDQAYGVVHSDLSKSNMLLCGSSVAPIDFGLWGYGYYYMDLGALASHYTDPWQQDAIFLGYESVMHSHVDRRYVEPFVCLGILLFICTFGESVYKEEWFPGALDRWTNTHFLSILGN